MSCTYSYLQENFYNRFDGAVSITVALKEFDNKVEGSSPSKIFSAPVLNNKLFFANGKRLPIFVNQTVYVHTLT